MSHQISSVDSLISQLGEIGYIADRGLATSVFIAIKTGRPILLEGEVGVGKTELAKALATLFSRDLIRLQCYEGIDTNQALYEWDYARQLLHIRALRSADENSPDSTDLEIQKLFSEKFLLERPLLTAIRKGNQAVLLIDEIDRADDEFEAFLLELLSDFQVTIPELGTIKAESKPIILLTSNRTRELHDALKRRCLYNWIGFPPAEREVEIVKSRIPLVTQQLAEKVVAAVNELRDMELQKAPGVAETIDWVDSLTAIGESELTLESAQLTIGAVVKDREDLETVLSKLEEII